VVSVPRSTISTPPAETYTNYDTHACKPATCHGIMGMWSCATKEKLMTECIPAHLRNGEIVTSRSGSAMRIARQVLTEREGPRPTSKHVCRHLCQNDSIMRNGFLCVLHTVWGTRSENMKDVPIETRCASAAAGAKTINNLEYTCPHCGKEGRSPSMKRWHFDRCKLRPQ